MWVTTLPKDPSLSFGKEVPHTNSDKVFQKVRTKKLWRIFGVLTYIFKHFFNSKNFLIMNATMKMQVLNIRLIDSIKESNGTRRNVNSVYIDVKDAPSIRRSFDQFIIDLRQNSDFSIPEGANINHPSVREAIRLSKGGFVSGDLQIVHKGDAYEVTAESSVVTNPNDPDYGRYAIGDTATVRADSTRVVDGFLTIEGNQMAVSMQSAMNNAVMAMMQSFNGFGMPQMPNNSVASTDEPEVDETAEADAEIINAIKGN